MIDFDNERFTIMMKVEEAEQFIGLIDLALKDIEDKERELMEGK
jgi:hypothetical protein